MNDIELNLLKELCAVRALPGDESPMKEFILRYIDDHVHHWMVRPQIFSGDGFQDCVVLVFGKPRVAVYAHMDSVGFTVGYNNRLIKAGAPVITPGIRLVGNDSQGSIDCELIIDEETEFPMASFHRNIDPGTGLTYLQKFVYEKPFIQSCYIDNRLGVWVALQLASTLENGAIVFSCWEEHGGGTAGYLSGFLYEKFRVSKSLICDITWVTQGVHHGKGVAVSNRDSGIPRRTFVKEIQRILTEAGIPFQTEVESAGGSDGNEIQKAPFPVDWCFVGAPEDHVHSPEEKVHEDDVWSMLSAYRELIRKL